MEVPEILRYYRRGYLSCSEAIYLIAEVGNVHPLARTIIKRVPRIARELALRFLVRLAY